MNNNITNTNLETDVAVIGSGPGGYVCALKCAKLGFKVTCIEKNNNGLGGTCLNVGCIPSKSLLHSSQHYYDISNGYLEKIGIKCSNVEFDLEAVMTSKNTTISELQTGINTLFLKNKVTHIEGTAHIENPRMIKVIYNNNQTSFINTKYIVIATGSEPVNLPGLNIEIDEQNILSSTGALKLKTVPQSLGVIGAGAIGLEMGSVWSRFKSKVTIIEYLDRIAANMDGDISKSLQKIISKQNTEFLLNTKVIDIKSTNNIVNITIEDNDTKKIEERQYEKVLISIGRKPYTQNLGLEKLGIKKNEKGYIIIDRSFKTNIDNIYAIGDVVPGPMLAHKASEEGIAVAEILAGQKPYIDYNIIPSVIYTHPEAASIGSTEEELKKLNIPYNIGKANFIANSRAKTMKDTYGFVKILACKNTDTILGAHIVNSQASTLINQLCTAMTYKAASEDIARICHSHPDLNEAIREACMSACGIAIH